MSDENPFYAARDKIITPSADGLTPEARAAIMRHTEAGKAELQAAGDLYEEMQAAQSNVEE